MATEDTLLTLLTPVPSSVKPAINPPFLHTRHWRTDPTACLLILAINWLLKLS